GYSFGPVQIDPALAGLSFELSGTVAPAPAPVVDTPAPLVPEAVPSVPEAVPVAPEPAPTTEAVPVAGGGEFVDPAIELPSAGMLPGTVVFPVLPPFGSGGDENLLAITTREGGYHGLHVDIAPYSRTGDYQIVAPGPGWTVAKIYDDASCIYVQELGQYFSPDGTRLPNCDVDMQAAGQTQHPSLNMIFLEQDHGDGTKTVMRFLHLAQGSIPDYIYEGYVTVGGETLAELGNQGIMIGSAESTTLLQQDPATYAGTYARHLHIDIHEERFNAETQRWEYYDAVIPSEGLFLPPTDNAISYAEIAAAASNAGLQWTADGLTPISPVANSNILPQNTSSPDNGVAPGQYENLQVVVVPNEPWLQNMTMETLLAMDPATLDFYGHGGIFDEAMGFRYVYGTVQNLGQIQTLLGPGRLDVWYELPEMAPITSLTDPYTDREIGTIREFNTMYPTFESLETALLDIDPALTYDNFRQLCNDRGIPVQLGLTIMMNETWMGQYFRIVSGTDPTFDDPMQTDADSSDGYLAVVAGLDHLGGNLTYATGNPIKAGLFYNRGTSGGDSLIAATSSLP
ncbi:MAG: hypothetical protein V1820_00995, partial [archaeon]